MVDFRWVAGASVRHSTWAFHSRSACHACPLPGPAQLPEADSGLWDPHPGPSAISKCWIRLLITTLALAHCHDSTGTRARERFSELSQRTDFRAGSQSWTRSWRKESREQEKHAQGTARLRYLRVRAARSRSRGVFWLTDRVVSFGGILFQFPIEN